jgi:FixJ family two-component response regulator
MNKPSLVYIVDDEILLCDALKRLISSHRFIVKTFNSAQTALSEISRQMPEFLITDFNLQGESGLDLISEIRKTHNDLPILLMTGTDPRSIHSKVQEFSRIALLGKPFELHQIMDFLAKYAKTAC